MELTILMPCLNEQETLPTCIKKAQNFLEESGVAGEVLIADNGSTDQSRELATELGARVIDVPVKGYGSALIEGIKASKGKFIIMGDADDSYDFSDLQSFIDNLRDGADLVMGNRFKGGIRVGAMPFLHRYLGNPVLSFLGRLFFKSRIGDFHCGLRGFPREKISTLELQCPGMEFASEMVVKATLFNLKIEEVPVVLYPDGRNRPPHLRTWRDGWRHLVFLLIYSPRWLFFYPGLVLLAMSVLAMVAILPATLHFNQVAFDIHTLSIGGLLLNVALQLLYFAVFVRVYSIHTGLFPPAARHRYFMRMFTLEKGIILGLLIALVGGGLLLYLLYWWAKLDFGNIDDTRYSFRILIMGSTLLMAGIQTIFASFFVRVIELKNRMDSGKANAL